MRKFAVVVSAAGMLGTFGAAAAAQAQDPFACRASSARVSLPSGLGDVEPIRANAALNPCSTQSSSVVSPTALGPLSADAVGAFTTRAGAGPGSAFASASHAAVALPGLTVTATAVEASATTTCNGTTPANSGTSRVAGLVVNGNEVVIPPGDAPQDIPLGPLGSISLNKEIVEGGQLTRRAIAIVTPVASVVIAEAIVGYGAGACTGGGGGGGTPPPVCPAGSTYDATNNVCVIHDSSTGTGSGSGSGTGGGTNGGSGGTAGDIRVGAPFTGGEGGTVMTLADARKRYKSPCLSGAGPKYVIVGTSKADKITGTNRSERILLLAGRDNAEGGRGNDCIDGGTGVDTISGALGSDRLYGGTGNDHLVGGSASDKLYGGKGNDTIHTGFGKDTVDAGAGNDKINASTAGPASKTLKCGKGRDKIRINRNEKRRVKSCEKVYRIR